MTEVLFTLRAAAADDAAFIEAMTLAAANWLPERQMTLDDLRRQPDLFHYASRWPLPGDSGSVAVDSDNTAIGAVWFRHFTDTDPGYGYVAADVPEVTIGVVPAWRGHGVGRALLRALASQARTRGIHTLSLSVERANPAMRLYVSEGWRVLESGRDSDTMILPLGRDRNQRRHETRSSNG